MDPDNDDDSGPAPASTPPALSKAVPARASINRAPPITLPSDPTESAALVLRFIQSGGSTAFDRSGALEAAALRLTKLQDADPAVALAELGGHAAILDALFQHWAARSVSTPNSDAAAKFAKLALASQGGYVRTLVAMEGLRQQRKGRGCLEVEIDHDNDTPGD